MLRKLAGYIPLTFLSFFLCTLLFHSAANAQTGIFNPAPTPIPPSLVLEEKTSTIAHMLSFQEPTATPTESPSTPTPTTPPPTQTPTPTQKPTTTPTPTPPAGGSPTATPTPVIPTATPTPQAVLAASTDLETQFTTYADHYHVSKDQLKKIAKCESSFNAQATNGDYTGMYQFATASWISARNAMGLDSNPDLRKDAGESIRTAAYMLSKGQENAWMNCK